MTKPEGGAIDWIEYFVHALGLIVLGFIAGWCVRDDFDAKPVYKQAFSFDRLAELDDCIDDLRWELRQAESTRAAWQAKARRLVGDPNAKVTISGRENLGQINIEGADSISVVGCTFLPDPNVYAITNE